MAGGEPGIRMTEIKREIRLRAKRSQLNELLDRLNTDLRASGCPVEKIEEIRICVEEIYVNIASYAYSGADGNVAIEERICENDLHERVLSLAFRDNGIPFNPLEHGTPDISLPEQERRIGALGIYMVKNMTDRIWYEYQDGTNCLHLEYRWQQV